MKRFFMASMMGFVLLTAPLYLAGCGDKVKSDSAEAPRVEITGVKVAGVKASEYTGRVEVSGTVKARTISIVASKVMGTVTSVRVKEGDRVAKGSTLLTIDDRDIQEKAKAAEAGVHEAQKALQAAKENLSLVDTTFERYSKLREGNAISEQEFNTIDTHRKAARLDYERMQESVKRAEAGLAEARVYRSYAAVTSPVNGVVAQKMTELGSMASPGTPLFVIEDTSSFLVEANADEALSPHIRKGMKVGVAVDSLSKTFDGTVTEAVPSVNPASRTFLVKISVSGQGLRSGQYARVSFPSAKTTALLLPLKAVAEKGQLTGVYTVDDRGVATYRLVRTGARYNGDVEILSGLNPGDKVIIEGADRATDGGIVKNAK
jgi:RND family efflux transporter MFP subunit